MRTALPLIGTMLAALVLTPVPAVAQAFSQTMLPPEIRFPESHFDGFEEPALWQPRARSGYRSRIRLSLSGILRSKVSIRIDELASGRLRGHLVFVELDGRARPADRTERLFRVERAQMEELRQLIAQARLWRLYPEFWDLADGQSICIDGMEMVFERVDDDGYRFSNANAQCTAPPPILAVARKLIEIAGAERVEGWLQ